MITSMNNNPGCAVCGGPYEDGYCEFCPVTPLPSREVSEERRERRSLLGRGFGDQRNDGGEDQRRRGDQRSV